MIGYICKIANGITFFESIDSTIYVLKNRTNVRNYRTNLNYLNQIIYMIEKLLDNKTKAKIARFFAENKGEYQVSDIARILRISKSRASECLKELEEIRFLESRKIGRSKLYTLADNEFAKIFKKALATDKTMLDKIEKEAVQKLRKFKPISIVLYGSALAGLKKGSDIDIAVILDNSVADSLLARIASEIETKYGITVSILPLEARDLKKRVKKGDEFAINLFANHKLLYGKKLEDLIWQ